MDKTFVNIDDAVADIKDGAMVAIGGFFSAGVPRHLLKALVRLGAKELTLACGSGPLLTAGSELLQLIENGQIKKIIDSYPLPRSASRGKDNPLEKKVRDREIELEVYPMGTLAEKYRAGGAGIPAFYVRTGIGTVVAEHTVTNVAGNRVEKEVRRINGEDCILEYALKPDFALIHAHTADPEGNLIYRKTARNFNHVMAMAGRVTIAEVESIVDVHSIDPERIHTAGIFVQRLIQVDRVDVTIAID